MITTIFPDVADGFARSDAQTDSLIFANVNPFRNEVSPFCHAQDKFQFEGTGIIVETCYGQVYEANRELPLAIYGKTEDLPVYAGDQLANLGYLRVPFRRIPRILVKDRNELESLVNSIKSADPNLRTLYRGQVREYYISRSARSRAVLFDDEVALEPSLTPSCIRAGVSLESIGPEWSMAVQLFLGRMYHDLSNRTWISSQTLDRVGKEINALTSSYILWPFLLGLAQHYGLPSAGLDVTSNLSVALYFALTEFRPDPNLPGFMVTRRRSPEGDPSVLYLITVDHHHWFNFSSVRPQGFPLARPDAQDAFFLHTGWGYGSNSIARYIFIALYLDPAGDWGEIQDTYSLFPNRESDRFGDHISNVSAPAWSDDFKSFLSRFYWAV
jgi:hypothetical protein